MSPCFAANTAATSSADGLKGLPGFSSGASMTSRLCGDHDGNDERAVALPDFSQFFFAEIGFDLRHQAFEFGIALLVGDQTKLGERGLRFALGRALWRNDFSGGRRRGVLGFAHSNPQYEASAASGLAGGEGSARF